MKRRPKMKMIQLEDVKERKGDKERVREREKERSTKKGFQLTPMFSESILTIVERMHTLLISI
jgi:hypothetical protein